MQQLFSREYSKVVLILSIMGAHNLSTQIKGLYKLVSVTKGNLFVIYESL